MSRVRWIIFIVIMAGSALFLFRYTFLKTRPEIPANELHLGVAGRPDDCLACHGPGGPNPRDRNHPPGRDCTQCHRWEGRP